MSVMEKEKRNKENDVDDRDWFEMLIFSKRLLECSDYIQNHHKKCIQISTNMPGIGLLIPEIT